MIAANLTALVRQGFNFGWVGIVAAIVHYGVLILLVEQFGAKPAMAALAGYVLGGAASYLLNRRWTFPTSQPHSTIILRFLIVAAVGFALTGLSMHILTENLHAPYLPAQIITTLIVLSWSFAAHRNWTFRPRSPSR